MGESFEMTDHTMKIGGLCNNRHLDDCHVGWELLDLDAEWAKLRPFEDWARTCFGYNSTEDPKVKQSIMYNCE
jgi:hypothetical protein